MYGQSISVHVIVPSKCAEILCYNIHTFYEYGVRPSTGKEGRSVRVSGCLRRVVSETVLSGLHT